MLNKSDILTEFLKRLISSPAQDQAVVSLVGLFEEVITHKKCLPSIDIPYDDITSFIYDFPDEIILVDLDLMMDALNEKIISSYPPENDGRKHDRHLCFLKFRKHIFLAATQKQYITKVAKDLSIEADRVAKKASSIAEDAKEQAQTAKKTYNDMMVNYITILGIFASIIITIFGGMQIISATTGLLQSNLSLMTLILVLSFLATLIILILSILLNWISNIKNDKSCYKMIIVALIFTIATVVASGIYMILFKAEPNQEKSKGIGSINTKILNKDESKK